MISEESYLNNTFSEFTLKYFCLISIRSEHESKIICSNERGSSQETQKGGCLHVCLFACMSVCYFCLFVALPKAYMPTVSTLFCPVQINKLLYLLTPCVLTEIMSGVFSRCTTSWWVSEASFSQLFISSINGWKRHERGTGRSDLDCLNRAKQNPSFKNIATFVSDLIGNCKINKSEKCQQAFSLSIPIPSWELLSSQFDTDYSTIRKEDTPHFLTNIGRSHIADN